MFVNMKNGAYVVSDDADWGIPGLHNRYRAAAMAALTRHVRNWAWDGRTYVSDGGCWSGRSVIVDLVAGTIETTRRDGCGQASKFWIRPVDLPFVEERMGEIAGAFNALAMGGVWVWTDSGEPLDESQWRYGDIRSPEGDIIPGDGRAPFHLAYDGYEKERKIFNTQKARDFLEKIKKERGYIAELLAAIESCEQEKIKKLNETYHDIVSVPLTEAERMCVALRYGVTEQWEIDLMGGIPETDYEDYTIAKARWATMRAVEWHTRCPTRVSEMLSEFLSVFGNDLLPPYVQHPVCKKNRESPWGIGDYSTKKIAERCEGLGEVKIKALAEIAGSIPARARRFGVV